MSKLLWIICVILFIVLVYVVYGSFDSAKLFTVNSKLLTNQVLPIININEIAKPPLKTSEQSDPKIYAKSAILIDNATHKILYEQNPDEKVPIASTTKIMTALVVLEDYSDKLNDEVTITKEMISVEGSDIQLRTGEKITVDSLLKGLLIYSGNDAAYSLAIYLDGKEKFVEKMNQKANYLGLKNTFYKDPAGLSEEGYSTAKDLSILSSYALRNKDFAKIVSTPNIVIASVDGKLVHDLKNSNRMLRSEEQYYYPFAIGIKTGFTNEAGHCLIGAARNNGRDIISVVLNTQENTLVASAKESKKLLEWGFANYNW